MKNHEIHSVLMNALSLQEVYVSGNNHHIQIVAIGEIFDGISRMKKQQIVYAPLIKYIQDNCIHALSIKTYTPKEWEHNQKSDVCDQ